MKPNHPKKALFTFRWIRQTRHMVPLQKKERVWMQATAQQEILGPSKQDMTTVVNEDSLENTKTKKYINKHLDCEQNKFGTITENLLETPQIDSDTAEIIHKQGNPGPVVSDQNIVQHSTKVNNSETLKVTITETSETVSPETPKNNNKPNPIRTDHSSTEPAECNYSAEENTAIITTTISDRIDEEQNSNTARATTSADASLLEIREKQSESVGTNKIRVSFQRNNESNPALLINDNNNPTEKPGKNISELETNFTSAYDTSLPKNQFTCEQESEEPHASFAKSPCLLNLPSNYSLPQAQTLEHKVGLLLTFVGLNPADKFEEHKRFVSEKYKCLPSLRFLRETRLLLNACTGIYTSNWPTWISPPTLRKLLNIFTDFNFSNGVYYLDVLSYKTGHKMGAALIRFANNKDCLRVYDQMRVITALQPKINVELDLGGMICKQIDIEKGPTKYRIDKWLDPTLPGQFRHSNVSTFIPAPKNYKEDQYPGECNRNKRLKRNSQKTTKTPEEEVILDSNIPLTVPAIIKIQNLLGLEHDNFEKNKLEIKQKTKDSTFPAISDNVLEMADHCQGIFMSKFPLWFEAKHYKHVLELLTDFDWNDGIYFIDILKYSNHANMGAILIKFANSESCLEVFKQLRCIPLLQTHVQQTHRFKVKLDIDGVAENIRKVEDPLMRWMDRKLEPQYRMRSVITTLEPHVQCPDKERAELNNPPEPDYGDDNDDEEILFTQNVPEIDLTEDDEGIEVRNKKKLEDKYLHIELSDDESDNSDKATISTKQKHPMPDDDLGELIDQELLGIDINKMIKEGADQEDRDQNTAKNNLDISMSADDETAIEDREREAVQQENSNDNDRQISQENENAKSKFAVQKTHTTEASNEKQFNAVHMSTQPTNTISENMNIDNNRQINQKNENAKSKFTVQKTHTTEASNKKQSNAVHMSTQPTSTISENMNITISNDVLVESDDDMEEHCKIVYVRNLPLVNTFSILQELISRNTKFDVEKKFFLMNLLEQDGTKESSGEGLLKFSTHEDAAEVASGLDGIFVESKIIDATLDIGHKVSKANYCYFGTPNPNTQVLKRKLNNDGTQRETFVSQPKRAKFNYCWDIVDTRRVFREPEDRDMNYYDLNKDFFIKMGCSVPLSSFVIVKNLHEIVNEAKLFEVFSLAGDVKQVTLSHGERTNETKENEFTAKIEYDHPVEAVQAVSMLNHQKLYDKEIEVSIDRTFEPRPLPVGLSGIGKGLGKNGEPVKGVRTNVELRQVYEILYEMGRMNKSEDKDQLFQVGYTKRTDPPPFIDTSSGVKFIKPGAKPATSQALEALGAFLVSLDAIPVGTNCSNLNDIIQALQKNPKLNQNTNEISVIQQEATPTLTKNIPTAQKPVAEPIQKTGNPNISNSNIKKPNTDSKSNIISEDKGSSQSDAYAPSTSASTSAAPASNPAEQIYSTFRSLMRNFSRTVNEPYTRNIAENNRSNDNANTSNLNPSKSNNQLRPNLCQLLPLPLPTTHVSNRLEIASINLLPRKPHFNQTMPNMNPNVIPNMQILNPNFPLMNPNVNPDMQILNPDMQILNPNFPLMNPNVNPDMQILNPDMQILNPNFPLMNPNVNPDMQILNPDMQILNPNFPLMNPNVNPDMQILNPDMQMLDPNFPLMNPNVNPNMQMLIPNLSNLIPNWPVVEPNIPMNCNSNMNPNGMNSTISDPNPLPVWGAHIEPLANHNISHPQAPVNPNIPAIPSHSFDPHQPPVWNSHEPIHFTSTSNQYKPPHSTTTPREQTAQETTEHFNKDNESFNSTTKKKKSHVIYFRNLPPSLTSVALTSKMKEVGEIKYGEMTGIGRAIVLFKEHEDSELCIRLFHRSRVDGHVINVGYI